jgi:hypothetical protein
VVLRVPSIVRRLLPFALAAFIAALMAPSALGLGLVPVNLLPPSISGSAQQGQTLTCSPGTWLNSPTGYSYTWQRTGSNISGATGSSYTLTSSDVGQAITCTVVANNASGNSLPALSLPVVPVGLPIGLVPVMTSLPSISGTAQVGQTLNCSTGAWTNGPTSYAYSWQRNAVGISGATSSSYTVTSSDVNQLITCTVVASNGSGSSVPAVSTAVLPISLLVPVNVLPPSISGSAQQGQTLTCSPGTWLNSPTGYAYSWQRTGSNIGGATGSSYVLTSSDVGQVITCTVVASNSSGKSLPAVSLPVVPLGLPVGLTPVMTSLPAISGSPQVGQTLTCSSGAWLNAPSSFAYSWQRDLSNISGANSSTYTVTSADVNQLITCTVIASNAIGPSPPAVSLPVVPTSLVIPLNIGLPQISGSPQVGHTLTCSPGSWTNSPTSYTYSWQRDLVNMTDATAPSYTVRAADVGHSLTCEVYAYNTFGQSLPAISQAVLPTNASTGGSGGTKGQAPTVSAFALRPHRIVERIKANRPRSKGATFRYRVTQAASVLITIQRRRGSGRYVKVGQLSVKHAAAGSDHLRWNVRVHGRLLAAGKYRAIITATDADGRSPSRSLTFSVVRRHT